MLVKEKEFSKFARMARKATDQPTEVELQILRVLWEKGASTVREVHEALALLKDTDYATTVKMLAVMLRKGLVTRDASVRPQIYKAAASQTRTQQSMLRHLIRRVYDGSATSVALQALSATKKASKEDLQRIRELIDRLEEDES